MRKMACVHLTEDCLHNQAVSGHRPSTLTSMQELQAVPRTIWPASVPDLGSQTRVGVLSGLPALAYGEGGDPH